MGEAIKNFLQGAGSILQIMPSPRNPALDRPDFLRKSVAERIGSDWARVGKHLQRAIEQVSREGVLNGAGEQAKSRGT